MKIFLFLFLMGLVVALDTKALLEQSESLLKMYEQITPLVEQKNLIAKELDANGCSAWDVWPMRTNTDLCDPLWERWNKNLMDLAAVNIKFYESEDNLANALREEQREIQKTYLPFRAGASLDPRMKTVVGILQANVEEVMRDILYPRHGDDSDGLSQHALLVLILREVLLLKASCHPFEPLSL